MPPKKKNCLQLQSQQKKKIPFGFFTFLDEKLKCLIRNMSVIISRGKSLIISINSVRINIYNNLKNMVQIVTFHYYMIKKYTIISVKILL